MANDAHEEFWGCTLTKEKKEYIWDPSAETEDDVEHKLQLTTACLGHKAKDKERNLIEVTTEDDDGNKITCPIVSLRVGGKECIHLDLGFCNTTKFTLKEGAGPLALCGVHLQALPLDFDENEDSSEDEEVPDLVPAKGKKKEDKLTPQLENNKKGEGKKESKEEKKAGSSLKRPLAEKIVSGPAKKKPVVEESEDDEEDMENGSDEEDSDDEEEMPSLLDGEAEEDSEEDSDEGDDEPEGDDVDSDGDEESDEDEEDSEEEEVKSTKKDNKKVPNGHGPKATPSKNTTKKKEEKTPVAANKKTPGKTDQTPKSQQAKKTPEELKAFLLKSPNLPKKFDKFANFMKNNMKVTDEKSQKDLWDYVQKNKK